MTIFQPHARGCEVREGRQAEIVPMPVRSLTLDANGLPFKDKEGRAFAAKILRDMVNELPESVYHLNDSDAEWIADTLVLAYLQKVKA